jgi:enhancing lycopene biosynthesis protein 2
MNIMKKFAVILCGCGSLDGSEIHEATMTLLAIDKHGHSYTIFAPDEDQYQVVNHITHNVMNEKRNMLVEAARIARGNIAPLSDFKADNFDALIFPGGNGSAKNLFTYGLHGIKMKIREDVAAAVKAMHQQNKPIGAMCIAPILLAKVLTNVVITLGTDPNVASDVQKMGATHINTQQTEVIADKQNMIFTTPCYMLPAKISDIEESAYNLIGTILENI